MEDRPGAGGGLFGGGQARGRNRDCALRLAELAAEPELPRGVGVVTGGSRVGEPLGRHPDVDMVSFTGSTVTGRHFLHYSADSNLKEVVLELGGKNPCIVLDDAEDLDGRGPCRELAPIGTWDRTVPPQAA